MTALPFAATAGGFLLVLAIVFPVAGVLLSLVLGGRHAERIALGLMPAGFGVAIAIAVLLWRSGKPLVYILGGFAPPLGIALRADGFSAVMLVTAAIVISAAGFFARANFGTPQGMTEARAPLAFWMLLQALWAALNIVFLGGRFSGPRIVALGEPPAARTRRRHYSSGGGCLPRELRLRRRVGANGCPATAVAGGGSVASGDRHRFDRGDAVRALSIANDPSPIRRSHRRHGPSARPVRHRFAACSDREWRSER
jgi:hypothetical protein